MKTKEAEQLVRRHQVALEKAREEALAAVDEANSALEIDQPPPPRRLIAITKAAILALVRVEHAAVSLGEAQGRRTRKVA